MGKGPISIRRDENGVPHVKADSIADLYKGLGYCHAMDRGLQMLLMRILGLGRASELLQSTKEMEEIDIFFRKMNWSGKVDSEVTKLTPDLKEFSDSYCLGVNEYLSKKYPWELKLAGYKPDAWTIGDTMLLSRMTGYLTLAQSQGEIERLLVEMVQGGVEKEKLEELFPGLLGDMDEALIRRIKLSERIVPEGLKWNSIVPRVMASNNWVVGGARSASGQAMLANDPHLENNRLPNVWYEISLSVGERYGMGATMPGIPALVIGKTNDLAWGVTYSFMDSVDSWMEECKDGKAKREDGKWVPFSERKEIIKRKGKKPIEVKFYENEHGVLDGDPYEEGLYLATRWATAEAGVKSLKAFTDIWSAKSAEEGMNCLGNLEVSFNWVFADVAGNIGYQMSGLLPKRGKGSSGFVPLEGWKKENDWQGFFEYVDLPRSYNPDEQYIVTANDDLNHLGKVTASNISMESYRADRIRQLIDEREKLTPEYCEKMQFDTYSLQAKKIMDILRPLLPFSRQGDILRDWDCCYDPESKGAYLFEEFYKKLLIKVFGKSALGEEVVSWLHEGTGIFADFYGNFDRVLLAERSEWFNGKSRNEIYSECALEALSGEAVEWGESKKYKLSNMFFGGKLPALFGFDGGPVKMRGGRASIHQGQLYNSGGRTTSFCPTFRMIAEMDKNYIRTALAGGPSDRRFSKWYLSGQDGWEKGEYKILAV